MNEIKKIVPSALWFDPNEKIFQMIDEETEEAIGDPYSYNDWIQSLMDISGVSEDLLGPLR